MTLFNGFGLGTVFHNPQLAGTVSYVLRKGLYLMGDVCLVFFIFKTFYQGRKSLFPFFLGLSIVWGWRPLCCTSSPSPSLSPVTL